MSEQTSTSTTPAITAKGKLDPRGPRFAAGITVVVLAVVLITASPIILALQALVFAAGAFLGPKNSPYGLLYAGLIRPRLQPPRELEEEAPPRFAQTLGLAFAIVGLVAYLSGATVVGAVVIGLALVAAFLQAAFGFCLGCEIYLLARRVLHSSPSKEVSA
ncbi:DUF4395 domain-containing protein [Tenggerimyces flavus]|uniref:DUF4395 domain-containing protein n=1 Tax=Tenggerimyces flavus TaxID=1708749 RepID=A0ABV7YKF9_9ACTN|nr:DUF4395 domain-containing protein [Tenggerimyces flavus]MBM7783858.1 hypothetical protein [Tenggerimyces flavus]